MTPELLIAATREWLGSIDFPEVLTAEPNRLEMPIYGPDGSWRMSVMAAADPLVAVSQQHYPLFLPAIRRGDAALLCDALSRKLSIGDFRLDDEDGSVMLQVVVPFFGPVSHTELQTVLSELICRPIVAFGKALFPLAQFATGVFNREACLSTIVNRSDRQEEPWLSRGILPERN
jgi:hypothetical protein